MNEPQALIKRLEDIGRSLSETPHALALIGLGSSGREMARLDPYSDLDFFVIVETGYQPKFLNDLSWLSRVNPIAFRFMNTDDGYKLLFEDGIFCEFAVFEPEHLNNIPFSPGRIVWKADGVSDEIEEPRIQNTKEKRSEEWLVGEALTNLYVGLGRELRGEKLSAMTFIQVYAVDRVVELTPYLETAESAFPDTFDNKRRYEARYPSLAKRLSQFIQGYERNCESARSILEFLDLHYDLNPAIKRAIFDLSKTPIN